MGDKATNKAFVSKGLDVLSYSFQKGYLIAVVRICSGLPTYALGTVRESEKEDYGLLKYLIIDNNWWDVRDYG